MSNEHNLVLYVDQELVEKTRELGFNLSKTFENHLKQLLMQFSTVSQRNNFNSTDKSLVWCGRRDLNLGSQAWKSSSKGIDWHEFFTWLLKDHRLNVSRNTLNYSKKYYACLLNRDLSEVRDLKETIRPNALKARVFRGIVEIQEKLA
jgi:hypothetical protein